MNAHGFLFMFEFIGFTVMFEFIGFMFAFAVFIFEFIDAFDIVFGVELMFPGVRFVALTGIAGLAFVSEFAA